MTASDLDGARIADEVERLGGTFGRAATVLVETGSTNDDAKAAAKAVAATLFRPEGAPAGQPEGAAAAAPDDEAPPAAN